MKEEPLKIRVNDGGKRKVTLYSSQVVVGRANKCDVVVDDPKCSKRHCKLEYISDGWGVIDLESRYGTKVNGSYANRSQLEDGDLIEIGDVQIQVEFEDGASVPDTAGKSSGAAKSIDPTRAPRSGRTEEKENEKEKEEDRSSQSISLSIYGVLFLLVFAGGGGGYVYFQQEDAQRQASRDAFWSATALYEQGDVETSISKFKEVSNRPSDVYRIAQQMMDLARNEPHQRTMRIERKKTEEAFRKLVHSTLMKGIETGEVDASIRSFRDHLSSLPEEDQDTLWFAHYEDHLDHLEQQVQKQFEARKEVKDYCQQWKETKKRARKLRDENRYGEAANRLVRFRSICSVNELNSKINSELMRIKLNAETHLDSQKRQIDRFIKSGETAKAKEMVDTLREVLYSYHSPLTSLYVNAVKKQMSVQRKLDKKSDSS